MAPQGGLKLCSFNIRNSDADDGPNSWAHRAETLVKLLRKLDADIFGLQEVLQDQLDLILDALPSYVSVGIGRIDGACEGEFAPILFRTDPVTLTDYEWFWLSETPEIPASKSWDTACERICTRCDFTFKGRPFRVYNTHLDHISQLARHKSVELILSRNDDRPTVVMGDFNALPADPPIQAMLKAGFEDSLRNRSQSTFHAWGTEEYGQIDYIFARGIALEHSWVVTDELDGRNASDHYPVLATLAVKTGSDCEPQ
ncbi:MAG: endonuclease/exonuclease/phosphatase family protein [Chlorobia bacterium]|nr:endonuclease/exonuclease/phosphatase family protein [Fimbriimonadaceae bacterium]